MGLLEHLPSDVRESVIASGVVRHYKRDHVVFHQGDPATSVYVVRAGRLAVQRADAHGHTAIIMVLGRGDLFGEMALLRGMPGRAATVRALEPTTTTMLTAAAFTQLRRAYPCVDPLLIDMLAERLDLVGQRLCEAYTEDVLHRCLKRLTDLAPDASTRPALLRITQENLAEMVGTTRPSVNHALRRLQDRGLLSLARGRIVVNDPQRLRVAANGVPERASESRPPIVPT